MLVQPPIDPLMTPAQKIAQCRLLLSRERYSPCHVVVADVEKRLAAIALDGKFYSFFKSVTAAQKALKIAAILSSRGEEVSITQTRQGYAMWVQEPDAQPAPSRQMRPIPPTFGPSPCTILSDRARFQPCHLKVSDLTASLIGIQFQDSLYSLYRQEKSADEAIRIVGKLCEHNDEVVIVCAKESYVICVLEPTAVRVTGP